MKENQVPASQPAREARGLAGLPCLNSDKCIDGPEMELSASHAKVAFALENNVLALCERHGVESIGFLTLTFPRKITSAREASKHYHSFVSQVVKHRYLEYIAVPERHEDGGIHYHLLVVCKFNVREPAPGYRELDYKAIKGRDYSSVGANLKREWGYLRHKLKQFKFGRHELLPVKSNAMGIAKYIAKYVAKGIFARKPEDKGVRLVRYSQGTARFGCRFSFNSPGAFLWRKKLKQVAFGLGVPKEDGETCYNAKEPRSTLKTWMGPKWAYKISKAVNYLRLSVYPTGKHYNRDNPTATFQVPDDVTNITGDFDVFERAQAVCKTLVREGSRLWTAEGGAGWLAAFQRSGLEA